MQDLTGKRIKCIYMDDPYNPVPSGTLGTIQFVDSIGQIHINWDNGQGLAINPKYDSYEILGD